MTEKLINGVPESQYGVWCVHGKHILVANHAGGGGMIAADPWPCIECTLEEVWAEMEARALEAQEALWREWRDSQ